MDYPNYFTRDYFQRFQIYFDIDDRLFARMQKDIRKKIEKSGDVSVNEVIKYWLERYWRKIFSDSIFDLFYLQCINFFRQTFGLPYSSIINDVIICFISTEYRFELFYRDGLSIFNSDSLKMQEPMELIDPKVDEINSDKNIFINKKILVHLLLEDALIALCECFDEFCDADAVAIMKKNQKYIEAKGLSFEELVQSFEEESFYHVCVGSATEYIGDAIIEYSKNLILESYPGFVDGRNFLGSAISLVQFKFLTDAVIEELQDKYRDENSQGKFIIVDVRERGGAYKIKLVELEPMRYKFNPKYTSEIGISIVSQKAWQEYMDSDYNDYEKHDNLHKRVIISGLYHWDLQLLSLDLPNGQALIITSENREAYNVKDTIEMQRYLAEVDTEDSIEDIESEMPDNYLESKTDKSCLKTDNLSKPRNLTVRLRTRDSLTELLQSGKTDDWKIGAGRENEISKVQFFNWDGSLMLEASFNPDTSERTEEGRLIIGFSTEDARIVRCEPPLKWVGQNPVSYVDGEQVNSEIKLSKALKKEIVITENSQYKPQATTALLTEQEQPYSPDDSEDLDAEITQLCETIYQEPVRVICCYTEEDGEQTRVLFRERRRGWYIEMLIDPDASEYRVFPSFLPLLEPDETIWSQLTQKATEEDWLALDDIFMVALEFPDSELMFAGADLIGEEVASEALRRFGFYVPYEELLPALIFENRHFGMILLSYLKHHDGFAKENLVSDCNTNECTLFESLEQAQQSLEKKLFYYAEES